MNLSPIKKSALQLSACFCLLASSFVVNAAYTIEVTDRHLFGPGPFPDQKLKTAWIRNINFSEFLNGKVKGFNNLGEEPNVSGEILQNKIIDGMLSDKTLINEDIDMSNAVIMNGQFNLLLAAVYGGSNEGDTYFYHDDDFNWWIRDDIAIDPGFPAGIVKMDNFTFTTGPRIIPQSIQSESGYPGGTNQTGSLEAGRVAFGRLGDWDGDGFLDGRFNAIGRFPMESIFLPGAPFVQLFDFKSDIPVTPARAALLSLASTRSHLDILKSLEENDADHEDIAALKEAVKRGLSNTLKTLAREKSADKSNCVSCQSMEAVVKSLEASAKNINGEGIQSSIDSAFKVMVKLYRNENA